MKNKLIIFIFLLVPLFLFLIRNSHVFALECGNCSNPVDKSYCPDAGGVICTGYSSPAWTRAEARCCQGESFLCEEWEQGYYRYEGSCYYSTTYYACTSDCGNADCCQNGNIIAGHCETAYGANPACWFGNKYKVCCKNDGSGVEAPCNKTGSCSSQYGMDLCPSGYTATAPNVTTCAVLATPIPTVTTAPGQPSPTSAPDRCQYSNDYGNFNKGVCVGNWDCDNQPGYYCDTSDGCCKPINTPPSDPGSYDLEVWLRVKVFKGAYGTELLDDSGWVYKDGICGNTVPVYAHPGDMLTVETLVWNEGDKLEDDDITFGVNFNDGNYVSRTIADQACSKIDNGACTSGSTNDLRNKCKFIGKVEENNHYYDDKTFCAGLSLLYKGATVNTSVCGYDVWSQVQDPSNGTLSNPACNDCTNARFSWGGSALKKFYRRVNYYANGGGGTFAHRSALYQKWGNWGVKIVDTAPIGSSFKISGYVNSKDDDDTQNVVVNVVGKVVGLSATPLITQGENIGVTVWGNMPEANNKIQLYASKDPDGAEIPGMVGRKLPRYDVGVGTSRFFYQVTDEIQIPSAGDFTNNLSLAGFPAGKYFLNVNSTPDPGACTGNPFCSDKNGSLGGMDCTVWADCSSQDWQRVEVEALPVVAYPWFQTTAGDIRAKADISSRIPAGVLDKYLSLTGLGGTHGVVGYYGQISTGDQGGQISENNWQTDTSFVGTGFGFDYFMNRLQISKDNLFTGDITGLDSGVYFADATQTITGNFPAGEKIVVFVNGAVKITSDLIVPPGSFLAIISKQDMTFSAAVTQAQGFFMTDGTLTIETGDQAFAGEGSFVGLTSLSFNRDLGEAVNYTTPAEAFVVRPDFYINAPAFFKIYNSYFREIAP